MSICEARARKLTNITLDIPALKYGREMEKHASNAFF